MDGMMNRNKFRPLIEELQSQYQRGDAWIDTVPLEINSVFFDNTYVNSLNSSNTTLMRALFEGALLQEVEWFLYEWHADKPVEQRTITYPDGKTFVINDLNDFVNYLIADGLIV
jgi:hypothetical protein